jgi:arylsulfatase A-like enzyme
LNPPNVLLLCVDSLRADAVFGKGIRTPNFDSYASTGAAFRQCIATATITTPSFASILTGCYPPRHGVRSLKGYRLPEHVITMAEAFRDAGFRTNAEVTGPLLPQTGLLRGFQHVQHRQGSHRRTPDIRFFDWQDRVIDEIESYVEPWFLLLHTFEVHRPFRPPPDFAIRWDRAAYESVVAASDEYLRSLFDIIGDNSIVVITGDHGENYPETKWETRFTRAAWLSRKYLHTSWWLSPVDERLAAVAVGHGYSLDETLVRVPLIISGPGVDAVEVDQQVTHVDIFPTVAELCRVPVPSSLDGRSLVPLMRGAALPEVPVYMEAGMRGVHKRSVLALQRHPSLMGSRTEHWKLLQKNSRPPILYKLDGQYRWDGRSAPDEKHDVHDDFPDVARSLETWMARVSVGEQIGDSGMTSEEEAIIERHLRDLGYL